MTCQDRKLAVEANKMYYAKIGCMAFVVSKVEISDTTQKESIKNILFDGVKLPLAEAGRIRLTLRQNFLWSGGRGRHPRRFCQLQWWQWI